MVENNHLQTLRARFSAAAETYDDYAAVQREAAEYVCRQCVDWAQPTRILEIGCGTGLLTAGLHRAFPAAQIDAVDVAPGMIEAARRRLADADAIHWIVGDVVTAALRESYDLVCSSSALHWIRPLERVGQLLADRLTPGGVFAAAVMLQGTLGELHQVRLEVAPDKPVFERLPSVDSFRHLLQQQSLTRLHDQQQQMVVHHDSVERLLRQLRDQGLTGGHFSRSAVPLNRGELARLRKRYQERYATTAGQIPSSYEVGYFTWRR